MYWTSASAITISKWILIGDLDYMTKFVKICCLNLEYLNLALRNCNCESNIAYVCITVCINYFKGFLDLNAIYFHLHLHIFFAITFFPKFEILCIRDHKTKVRLKSSTLLRHPRPTTQCQAKIEPILLEKLSVKVSHEQNNPCIT